MCFRPCLWIITDFSPGPVPEQPHIPLILSSIYRRMVDSVCSVDSFCFQRVAAFGALVLIFHTSLVSVYSILALPHAAVPPSILQSESAPTRPQNMQRESCEALGKCRTSHVCCFLLPEEKAEVSIDFHSVTTK